MPHFQRNIRFILFLILPILGFLLGWSLNQKNHELPHQGPEPTVEIETSLVPEEILPKTETTFKKTQPKDVDLSIFWETWNTLEANYLRKDDMSVRELVYGAAHGMVSAVDDPYTVFLDPEETSEFEESISGEFQGIGAELGIRDEQLVIVSPLKGSPAELAGIRAGDIIYRIDDEPTYGMSVEDAVMDIRGPKGEPVTLTIIRKDERRPLDIVIVRDNIVLESVEWEMRDGIAVISISQFGNKVVQEFQNAVQEVLLESPRGVIVDLRNNGGGLLDASILVMSEFLEDSIVVKTRGRKFGDTGDIRSKRGGAFLSLPLVVLVNEGSASASEIFAGAMQDHDRGLIVGQKTFGKGSVQHIVPLSDGSSLKVTIAEWLTPQERMIDEQGIMPDAVVEMTYEDVEAGIDPQLDRAIELMDTEEMKNLIALPSPVPGQEDHEPTPEEIIEEMNVENAESAEDVTEDVEEGEETDEEE